MNKIISPKLNLAFAFYLVAVPIWVMILGLFNIDCNAGHFIIIFACIYFFTFFISLLNYLLKGGKLNFKLLNNKFCYVMIAMMVIILISCLVNNVFTMDILVYFAYFLIVVCVCNLDNKWQKIIINTFIGVLVFSCVLSFISPYIKLDIFNQKNHPMALQFLNPNYSAHIISAITSIVFIMFNGTNTKLKHWFYGVAYLIFITFLFMNGSFISITALIVVEIFSQIFIGVKYKKFQYKMFILFVLLIPVCFLVDLIPQIEVIRTCKYNYFLECVAVFDNVFNTNILSCFNITTVPGADGWTRNQLVSNAIDFITDNPKNFIFGAGAGTLYSIKPHNLILSLWIEFGLFLPILFVVLFVMIFTKLIKSKFKEDKFIFTAPIIVFLICYIVISFVMQSSWVFVMLSSMLAKRVIQD